VLAELLGKAVLASDKALHLTYAHGTLSPLLLSSYGSDRDSKGEEERVYRVVSVLNEAPEDRSVAAWAYLIVESGHRPGPALLAHVHAVSNSLRTIRDVLHKR
jgi:hypothetical protein